MLLVFVICVCVSVRGSMCVCFVCDVLCVVVRLVVVLMLGFVCAFECVLVLRCVCGLFVSYRVALHGLIVYCACVCLCECGLMCVLFVIYGMTL